MSDISFNKNLLYSKTGIFYDELEHLKAASSYLAPNNYIVSSYTDEDLNTSYALYWVNEDQDIIPLTYNIKEGNGLYLENNKWKLNIDNLSIKENIAYELYIDNEAIINAYGDMTKGVIKIDNDICHFNKYEINSNNGTVLVNDNGNVSLSNRFLSLLDDLAFYKDNITMLTNEIDELIKITDEEMIFTLNVGDIIYYNEDKGYSKHLDSFDTDTSWVPKYICVIASGILPDKKARIIDLRLDNYQPMTFGIDLSYDLSNLPAYQNIPLYVGALDYNETTDNTSIINTEIKYDGNVGYIATNSNNWIDNYKNPFYKNEHYGFKYVPEIPILGFKTLTLDLITNATYNNLTDLDVYALKLKANNDYNTSDYFVENEYYNTAFDKLEVSDLTLVAYASDSRYRYIDYSSTENRYELKYPRTSTFLLEKYNIQSTFQSRVEQSWANIKPSHILAKEEGDYSTIINRIISNLHPHYGDSYPTLYGNNMRNAPLLYGKNNTNIISEDDAIPGNKLLNTTNGIVFGDAQIKYNYTCDVYISFYSNKNGSYFTFCDASWSKTQYDGTGLSTHSDTTNLIHITITGMGIDSIDANSLKWKIRLTNPVVREITINDTIGSREISEDDIIVDQHQTKQCRERLDIRLDVMDNELVFKTSPDDITPQCILTETNVYPIYEDAIDLSPDNDHIYYNVLEIYYDITLANKDEFIFNNQSYYFLNDEKSLALKKNGMFELYPYSESGSTAPNRTWMYGSYELAENGLSITLSNYTDGNNNINFINSITSNYELGRYKSKTLTNDDTVINYGNENSDNEYHVVGSTLNRISQSISGNSTYAPYSYLFNIDGYSTISEINLGSIRTPKEFPVRLVLNYDFKISSCWYHATQTLYGIFTCISSVRNGGTAGRIYKCHGLGPDNTLSPAFLTFNQKFNVNDLLILPANVSTPYKCISRIDMYSEFLRS